MGSEYKLKKENRNIMTLEVISSRLMDSGTYSCEAKTALDAHSQQGKVYWKKNPTVKIKQRIVLAIKNPKIFLTSTIFRCEGILCITDLRFPIFPAPSATHIDCNSLAGKAFGTP